MVRGRIAGIKRTHEDSNSRPALSKSKLPEGNLKGGDGACSGGRYGLSYMSMAHLVS